MSNKKANKMMKKRTYLLIAIVLSLILLNVYASIMSTDNLAVSQTPICGQYPNSTIITAQGIFNNQNYTLYDISAAITANQR